MADTPVKPVKPPRILSNGMTRLENVRRLQHYTQGPLERDLSFCDYTWDIPFGEDSSRQCVDIYTPKGQQGPFPTIIYVHGGGWFAGDRKDKGLGNALFFIEHGFAVAAIGYRLMDEAVYPAQQEDLAAGLAKVTELAEQFHLNMDRLGIVGGSAGTPLGMALALSDPRFKAVCMTSSILDFASITRQLQALNLPRSAHFGYPEQDWSVDALLLGNAVQAVPKRANALCARLHVHPDMPHCLLFHGTRDNVTPFLQDVEFAEAAAACTGDNGRVTVELAPGEGHNIKGDFMPQRKQMRIDFMKKHLFATQAEVFEQENDDYL